MDQVFARVSQIARLLAKGTHPALLSTIGLDGGPRTRYIGEFRIRDTGEIFLISPSTANKIQEIRKNPQVQVIFSSKDCKQVLTLSGSASILDDISLRLEIYEEKKSYELYPVFNDYFGAIRFIPVKAEYLDVNVSNSPVVIKMSRD